MLEKMRRKKIVFWGTMEEYQEIKFKRLILIFHPDYYISDEAMVFGKPTIKKQEVGENPELFYVICSTDIDEYKRIERCLECANVGYTSIEQLRMEEEKIRNMPQLIKDEGKTLFVNRQKAYWNLVNAFFNGDKKIKILEIGVFQAALISGVSEFLDNPIDEYVGVDPYMGTEDDPYFGSYFHSHEEASKHYAFAKNIFERYPFAKLIREKSDEYMTTTTEKFDVIIVDGDHRFEGCLSDLMNAKKILKPGGIIIVDDYANVDQKDVTLALNRFLKHEVLDIHEIKYSIIQFQNSGKFIPVSLTIAGIRFDH